MSNHPPFRYLAISDQGVCPDPVSERINRLFELGVPAVQFREKTQNDRIRHEWLRRVDSGPGRLLVNGRWDLATLASADGVHSPADGLPIEVLRELNNSFLYGASTHTGREVRNAEQSGTDYVTFGPVYPTPSKPNLDEDDVPGLEALSKITDETDLPVLALGGVTPSRVRDCLDAGADGVAGIRALFEPDDPAENWKRIQSTLTNYFEGV